MGKVTQKERFVLYVMRNRKYYKQAINKIAKDVIMEKEELRKILISLREKGYLGNIKGADGTLKWVVR